VTLLRYIDVVLLLVAAPILLLIGVPAVGYCAGAGAWIVLRAAGEAVDRYAPAVGNRSQELTLRVVFMLCRIFLLALTVIVVRESAGKNPALTTLIVIVFAFTIHLALSALNRPRSR
jgi:hypothetical protein